jgi:hypothetical protein
MYELVRRIWEEEWISEEWKETITVPIHKRGDGDRCENYSSEKCSLQNFVEYNIGKN